MAANRISRRQRFLGLALLGGLAFVVITAVILRVGSSGEDETHLPGEELEGLTAELNRDLPADRPEVTFSDATDEVGIRFRHFPGRRTTRLPEDMGSGAAWSDYDQDGWLDLFVVNQAGPIGLTPEELAESEGHSALFRSRGNGTFEEVSLAAGVAFRGTGMGAAWGDFDADGWPDLLVTSYGPLTLYRNSGDGTFEDVTAEAGLAEWSGFWTGVSWADYDRDGDLDAYVTGYVRFEDRPDRTQSPQYDIEHPSSLNPSAFEPERNLLLRNEGDGTFAEVALRSGVIGESGRSLAAAWSDLDADGWPDLYVANDVSDNALYLNDGNGLFTEVSHQAMVADYRGAMGIAVGDWDGDADRDIFVTHWIAQENALFDNQLDAQAEEDPNSARAVWFMDEADRFGLGQIALDFIGWGTSFFDYDNDGRLDLMVVNGSTFQDKDDTSLLIPMRDQLFWNAGPERGFFDVSGVAGEPFTRELVGRGAAFGDFDNDGDVDVFIVNHGGPGVLLRNDAPGENAWLQVELRGRESNRDAVGAQVRLVTDGRVQIRELGSQPSYLSQNSLIQHFGLGSASMVDTLEVWWPSGGEQRFTDLPVRRRIVLDEGGTPVVSRPPTVSNGTGNEGGARTEADPEESRERELVTGFWESYREATDLRIQGRLQAAADSYRRALALQPDHEDALYYLGNVLMELEVFPEARQALERLVERDSRSSRGFGQLGVLHLCRVGPYEERLQAAEEAFLRAASINRDETGPHLRLVEVALRRGDADSAGRALQTVLGSNPASGPAHALAGYLAWKAGDKPEAEEAFLRAREVANAPLDGLVSGEGDTRPGQAPADRPAPCPTVVAYADSVLEMGAAGVNSAEAMEMAYEGLERLLEALRKPL